MGDAMLKNQQKTLLDQQKYVEGEDKDQCVHAVAPKIHIGDNKGDNNNDNSKFKKLNNKFEKIKGDNDSPSCNSDPQICNFVETINKFKKIKINDDKNNFIG